MQVKESYDLIVIGDQLSGLFLAAGAAQAGLKVLVLEESSLPAVSYEIPSGRLLGDFLAEPLLGLSPGNALDSFLKSLGLYQQPDDLFPPHGPALQMVGKGFRFDFRYGDAAPSATHTPAALQRLLRGDCSPGQSFAGAVAEAGLPVDYELFGWMQAALYGSATPRDLSYAAYKEVLGLAARGVRYVSGGRSALKERLISRITVSGGAIKRATRVEEIVFERGRLAGVLLSSYEGFVRSPAVVGAMGARTFLDLVPTEHQPAKLVSAVRNIQPRFWKLSVAMLVPERSLPEGLGTHAVHVDLDAQDFVQLQVFPKEAYGGVPAHHKVVMAKVHVPFRPELLGAKAVARQIRRCLGRVQELVPFLTERPFLLSPDPARLAEDPVFPRYFSFASLDHIPPAFLAFETSLSTELDQRAYLDWSRFGLKGLALCSRDIYPLFGLAGEAFAAMDFLANLQKKAKG